MNWVINQAQNGRNFQPTSVFIQCEDALNNARRNYARFLDLCEQSNGTHTLTPNADTSIYATCFWIFGQQLLGNRKTLIAKAEKLDGHIRKGLAVSRQEHESRGSLNDKPYRQLLAFCLSALSVIETLTKEPLESLVTEQLPKNVRLELRKLGCLDGKPQSGNQAMFIAIFLLHAKNYLGHNCDGMIDEWKSCHISSVNNHGFWGKFSDMTVLQFQNGYHQYEIFDYLDLETGSELECVRSVARMADNMGHFAPYPGGGGCFDYDAIFMLTRKGSTISENTAAIFQKTMQTILLEQNPDGGFCENHLIRPRCTRFYTESVKHIFAKLPNVPATIESLRYFFALQKPRHDRIFTHWSKYARGWNESNLWDSWFRMLTLARIDCALNKNAESRWGFINYPGIGYHHSLDRSKQ